MTRRTFAYDIETYPNCFTLAAHCIETGEEWVYEISERRSDQTALIQWLWALKAGGLRMVGYNNVGFDYPVIHLIIENAGFPISVRAIYDKAQSIITSDDRFAHIIWDKDRHIEQIDLFKIHHFDNVARATSLKMLEFNMRSANIEDLPFPVGQPLAPHQVPTLIKYNLHDVRQTVTFYHKSAEQIRFREELTAKYGRNFMNHNDTKIGKDYFVMQLEAAGVECFYKDSAGRRQPRQTVRPQIHLADVVFPYVRFEQPEFERVRAWLVAQTITETKGVFKDLSATVDGFRYDFGTGGIHGSVESQIVRADADHVIIDLDVASYYPNLAIANSLAPAHLGAQFCRIYADVYEMRKQYKKGTAENAMLKLALNGVYGDSNNAYSPFYDPAYTMAITINGQLLLCMLAEQLIKIPGLQMVQINTDGLTVRCPRAYTEWVSAYRAWWQDLTRLELEEARYSRMFIRDVNNYIAEYEDGKLKRKGAYEYDGLGWHQNHGETVIAKAAEAALVRGADVRAFIEQHPEKLDFMLRTKVPRSSRLLLVDDAGAERQLQNICRYHVAHDGGALVKVMPPLAKKPDHERRIGINVGWKVAPCNALADFDPGNLNFDYYVTEAEKLVKPLL